MAGYSISSGSGQPANQGQAVRPYRQPVVPSGPRQPPVQILGYTTNLPGGGPGGNKGERPATYGMQFIQNNLLTSILGAIRGIKGGLGGPPKKTHNKVGGQSFMDLIEGTVNTMSQLLGGARQLGGGLGKGNFISALFGGVRAGRGIETMLGAAGRGGGGAGGGAAGAAGGGAMRALGGLGKAGPIGAIVAGTIAIGVAAIEFNKELKRAADNLVEFNRKFSEIHAGMALLYAQRDLREMLRDRDKASLLVGPTSRIIANEQKFKDETFPWQVAWEELKSGFLNAFYQNLVSIAEATNSVAKIVGVEFKNRPLDSSGSFGEAVMNVQASHYKRLNDVMPPKKGKE